MTRMMLYTFHGPNRTGASCKSSRSRSPVLMTLPLVVLEALSVVGGWLNVPAFLPV
jgi:NADH-quinone oxidoreductase subunit L